MRSPTQNRFAIKICR